MDPPWIDGPWWMDPDLPENAMSDEIARQGVAAAVMAKRILRELTKKNPAPKMVLNGTAEDALTIIADGIVAHDRVLTCAFCGHAYPQGTPTHKAACLAAHIRECPEHPVGIELRRANDSLNMYRERLADLELLVRALWANVAHTPTQFDRERRVLFVWAGGKWNELPCVVTDGMPVMNESLRNALNEVLGVK